MEIQLSVIVPFYNEEKNLTKLHQELISVLSNLEITCEIVYVNDGSKDKSVNVLMKEISREKRDGINIILISLKNNFGQTAAVSAGIDNSKGKYVSFLDADLQNNPKDIERFYEEVEQGYDAVFGWRRE